jgi:multidrug transporter EmrE-like cation transporter
MTTLNSLLLITCGVAFSIGGDVFLKKSQLHNGWFMAVGIILYACGAIPVAVAFKKLQFGSMFLIWEAVTVISALLVANWLFKEAFTPSKSVALLLAIGALYFSYR